MTIEALVKAAVAEGLREQMPTLRAEIEAVVRAELDTARAKRLDDASADLLTVNQAANVVGVHPDTVRTWVREGKVADRGVGRVVRVSRAELLAVKAKGPGSANVVDLGAKVDELMRRDRG